MKKRFISALITMAMLTTLLTGCGGSANQPTADSASGEEQEAGSEAVPADENADAGDNTTVADGEASDTVVVWVQGNADRTKEWDAAEEIFHRNHPDVAIEWSYMASGDLDIALTTMASSGDYSTLPDIVLNQDYYFDRYVTNYPDLFMDISDIGIDWDGFASFKVDNSVVNGKHYGVPYENGCCIAAYRTDVLEEAGYTLEDLTDIDWNEYIRIGGDVYAKTGLPLLTAVAAEPQIISMMIVSAGEAFFREDGSVNVLDNQVLKKSIELYKEAVEKGVIREINDWSQYSASFANSETAGTINGCWIIGTILSNEDQSGLWGVTNLPKLPDVSGATNYSANAGSSFAVIESNATASEEHLENVKALLNETWGSSLELAGKSLAGGKVMCLNDVTEVPEFNEEVEFFGGQKAYADIVEYSKSVPSVKVGAFYYNGIIAAGTATSNIIQSGADIDEEMKGMDETLRFEMENG